jgi:hypothetical protein
VGARGDVRGSLAKWDQAQVHGKLLEEEETSEL